ncbi:MAG: hypothetical protein AAB855_02260, partial [Patescibacteria group bacterium]
MLAVSALLFLSSLFANDALAVGTYCVTTRNVGGYARPSGTYQDCRVPPLLEEAVSGLRSVSNNTFCTNQGKTCTTLWATRSYTSSGTKGFCQGKDCITPFPPYSEQPLMGVDAILAYLESLNADVYVEAVGSEAPPFTDVQFSVYGLLQGTGMWNGAYPWSYYMGCSGYSHDSAVQWGDRTSIGGRFENIGSNQSCALWMNGINGFIGKKSFSVQRNVPNPVLNTFTANNQSNEVYVSPGEDVRLDWTTTNAQEVSISSSKGDVSYSNVKIRNGNITGIRPRTDRTYTAVAKNAATSTASKSVNVKISKPYVAGFTANGVRDRIVIISGQEVRLDWATENAEWIGIDGFPTASNEEIKADFSGAWEGMKPGSTKTFTLKVWNQQWGYGNPVSVTIEVQALDYGKIARCAASTEAIGVGAIAATTTLSVGWAPCMAAGAAVGAAVGFGVGAIPGAILGVLICGGGAGIIGYAVGITACYMDITIDQVQLAKALGAGISALQQPTRPPSFSVTDNRPPVDFTQCPPGRCIILPPSQGPSGTLTTNQGGTDQTVNWMMTISAEKSAWQYGVENDPYNPGNVRVKGDGQGGGTRTLTYQQGKAILGACGDNIGCLRSRINATLGISDS